MASLGIGEHVEEQAAFFAFLAFVARRTQRVVVSRVVSRVHRCDERCFAGARDRRRRQTLAQVHVVWRVESLQVGEHRTFGCAVVQRGVDLQFHVERESVVDDSRHERALLGHLHFFLDERGDDENLVRSAPQTLRCRLDVVGERAAAHLFDHSSEHVELGLVRRHSIQRREDEPLVRVDSFGAKRRGQLAAGECSVDI